MATIPHRIMCSIAAGVLPKMHLSSTTLRKKWPHGKGWPQSLYAYEHSNGWSKLQNSHHNNRREIFAERFGEFEAFTDSGFVVLRSCHARVASSHDLHICIARGRLPALHDPFLSYRQSLPHGYRHTIPLCRVSNLWVTRNTARAIWDFFDGLSFSLIPALRWAGGEPVDLILRLDKGHG